MVDYSQKGNDFDQLQNVVDVFVGAKIRLRRLVLGMAQSELAEAAGFTLRRLQAIEAGEERLGVPHLLQLSQLLDAPISWFFIGVDSDAQTEFGGRMADRDSSHKLHDALEQLNYSFKTLTNSDHQALALLVVNWLADLEMREVVDNSDKH